MVYHGNPVSEGIAMGKVMKYEPFVPVIECTTIRKEDVSQTTCHYEDARNSAKEELEVIRQHLLEEDPEKAKIMKAHIDILFDVALDEEIRDAISLDLKNTETAVETVFRKYIKRISKAKDKMIRERVADLEDVRRRLLRNCMGIKEENLVYLAEPVIVVAHDLFPSDTASMDRKNVLAIVTEEGGSTSHTAIIARSYEIPALLGVRNIFQNVHDSQQMVVDAVGGLLITDPSAEELDAYTEKGKVLAQQAAETKQYLEIEPVAADGTKMEVELNICSASLQEMQSMKVTNGVGLFRTEFLFMGRDSLPTEDEQYEIYRKVLLQAGNDPVILRTLDIGGDKKLDCLELPKEDNPLLGNRALRFCFEHRSVFKTQLRAALRAGAIGNLWIMFPMVGSIDDIRNAKDVVREVQDDLDRENIEYGKHIKFGIMIEIPSIAIIADLVVKEVDFASIGTNDLCQYTTAVDRMNPNVANYYQSYHPSMFRLIRYAVEQFNKAGKPIGVCGEMGGDKLALPVLLGFGLRRISMGIASVAHTKKIISRLTMDRAKELSDHVCEMETAEEIEFFLKVSLADIL